MTNTKLATIAEIQAAEQNGWSVKQIAATDSITGRVLVVLEQTSARWHKQDRRTESGAAFVSVKGADAS